jgi:hypothetical protein
MKFLIALLIFTQTSLANFKSLSLESDKSPYELVLLGKHLSQHVTNQWVQYSLIQDLIEINMYLSMLSPKEAMTLVKIHLYKSLMGSVKINNKNNQGYPNALLVMSAASRLENNKLVYSDLTKWLIEALLSDWDKADKKKPKPIFKRSHLWLSYFTSYDAEEFNQLLSEVCAESMAHLKTKLKLLAIQRDFKAKTKVGFILPKVDKPSVKNLKSLESTSNSLKREAEKTTSKIESDDLSNASQEIDKVQEGPSFQWKPSP